MFEHENSQICSIEQLIQSLEHIEESELKSDIRQNVRAELKRIKRNVSSILAFTAHALSPTVSDPRLVGAVVGVRRECIAINSTISKFLILQTLHADTWLEYSSRVADEYTAMAEALRKMCEVAAPLHVQQMANAL
jgi:hypothetical protein